MSENLLKVGWVIAYVPVLVLFWVAVQVTEFVYWLYYEVKR